MDGKVIIGTELDTKGFDKGIKELENEKVDLDVNTSDLEETKEAIKDGINEALKETEAYVEALQEMFPDLDIASMLSDSSNEMNNLVKEADKFGKSIANTIKRLGRMALAVFGIRSVFSMIRNAMSTLSQYDAQLKADIDYMKNAIAFALEPVVRKIVELAQKLMYYIAYIIKAWTGKNIFENANKSLQGANKEAKKLSKTLAGFDEMNVLQDTSSGNGGGVTAPSFDLSNIPSDKDMEGTWVGWIAKNGDLVALLIGGITSALIALKFHVNGFLGLGIGIALVGLIQLIRDVINFIKDPTWENFGKILESLSVALIGVAIAMMAVDIANPIAGIILLIALVTALTALIIKNWDKIKATLSKAFEWIKSTFNQLPGWAKGLLRGIGNAVIFVLNFLIDQLNALLLPLRAVITAVGKVTGKKTTLSAVSIPRVPYLAKGGIVNMPGKGVPIGGAIAGESGREAVLPLQDSQVLQEIADAIGRRITINANIVNSMNGRVISKELQKIQTEENFAFNR